MLLFSFYFRNLLFFLIKNADSDIAWVCYVYKLYYEPTISYSRVAQWKRAGPITQRSEDRNLALLKFFVRLQIFFHKIIFIRFIIKFVL